MESIELIQEWSKDRTSVNDFMDSATGVMAFNACVMRFQVIAPLKTAIEELLKKY